MAGGAAEGIAQAKAFAVIEHISLKKSRVADYLDRTLPGRR